MTMSVGRAAGLATVALAGLALGAGAYAKLVRPWQLHWGATPDEVARPMLGDELVPHPDISATRAVTIEAPPSAVWPWLVQMGYRRAGWYSYDRFDNDAVHVRRIVPELQRLEVGDEMKTGPEGGFRVAQLEPERSLVLLLRGDEIGVPGDISTTLLLEPIANDRTRLIQRFRASFRGLRGKLTWLVFDFGDFVMMRRELLGIKERAEGVASVSSAVA